MNRNITNRINYVLDNWLPPRLRDNRFLMGSLLKLVAGKKYPYYMNFKQSLPGLSEKEINQYYVILADTFIKRKTDLNKKCILAIQQEIVGTTILDAAAGKGYLAGLLYKEDLSRQITALDIVLPDKRIRGISYKQASLTSLPYENQAFDTVICTHALEHIKDIGQAVSELKRVCKRKLIIVLPRQREYLYTIDLHINFFPYQYNIERILGTKAEIKLLGYDWFCMIDLSS